jgi:BlaI family penicillinase repressor
MPRTASRHPTELELEILKILWRTSGATAREVQDALRPARQLATTSVVTVLNIMTRKRYLRRRKAGACFRFEPSVTERATARRMLGDLVKRAFRGSRASALLGLLEDGDLDRQELDLLRKLVEQKTAKPPE